MKLRSSIALGFLATVGLSTPAAADTFVSPLDTVPKPFVTIGLDHSVTMGIERDCSDCHNPGDTRTRLDFAKRDLLRTLPLFKDYFVFGSFAYQGCGYADVTQRVLPTVNTPDVSYNNVTTMISSLTHCRYRENALPNNTAVFASCITPTVGCSGDPPIVDDILSSRPPGIRITPPTVTATVCSNPASPVPTYDVTAALISKFTGGAFNWPRFDPSAIDGATVEADVCDRIETVFRQIQTELVQCTGTSTAVWDLTFLDPPNPDWCQENVIANTICTSWPTAGTCVCDEELTGPGGATCFSAGVVGSECGVPFTFKARQQVAVCEMYNPAPSRFGSTYRAQTDDILNGPLPDYCRENVGMFVTDGYMGDTAGVAAEAANALSTYLSVSGLSNLFVFRVVDPVPRLIPFIQAADAMQDEVAGPNGLTLSLDASTPVAMQASFAQVLSRIYKGVYTGASMTTDEFATRAYINSFTVPGYSNIGPVSDTYIGWPQRLSAYAIDPNGNVSTTPLWETDWSSRVSAGSCGPSNPSTIPYDTTVLGPGGMFRNLVPRDVTINTPIDRNGDGVNDPIPGGAGGGYTWGKAFGLAATEPVVVDSPREAVGGDQAASFVAHQMAVRGRRRAVYVQSNGYVLGFDGGAFNAAPTSFTGTGGTQRQAFSYTENGSSGSEILRYMPNWVNDPMGCRITDTVCTARSTNFRYAVNDLIQQPILNGDLEAREVYDGSQWRTVLAGNQGPDGRGFFTLDVTDPCNIQLLGEWMLPGLTDRASNEPKIYIVPTAGGPRPALIVTGGLKGSNRIFAYGIDGSILFQSSLAGAGPTATYATTPVCVDARGEGFVTHCYALRTDGHLARITLTSAGFSAEANVTPTGGSVSPIGGGRYYYTAPVAFFSADGAVNLVFGSGDIDNLTQASGTNYVFKATDKGVRKKTVPNTATSVATSCYPDGGTGPTEGVFPLAGGERMVSTPVVVGGGVFWTGYASTTNGCIAGQGTLYGINYETCYDILSPVPTQNRPSGRPAGAGIPLTPTVNRRANRVYTQTTAGPTAGELGSENARLRGGAKPIVKRLYWRPFMDIR